MKRKGIKRGLLAAFVIALALIIPIVFAGCNPPTDTSTCINSFPEDNTGDINYDISNPSLEAPPGTGSWEPGLTENYGSTNYVKAGSGTWWAGCRAECLNEAPGGDLFFGASVVSMTPGETFWRTNSNLEGDFSTYVSACTNGYSLGAMFVEVVDNAGNLVQGKKKAGLYAQPGVQDYTSQHAKVKWLPLPTQDNFVQSYNFKLTAKANSQHQSHFTGDSGYTNSYPDHYEPCVLRMIANKNLQLPGGVVIAGDDVDTFSTEQNYENLYIPTSFTAKHGNDDLALDAQDLATCMYNWDECMGHRVVRSTDNTAVYECSCCTGFGSYYGDNMQESTTKTETLYKACTAGSDWLAGEKKYACSGGIVYQCHYADDTGTGIPQTSTGGTMLTIGTNEIYCESSGALAGQWLDSSTTNWISNDERYIGENGDAVRCDATTNADLVTVDGKDFICDKNGYATGDGRWMDCNTGADWHLPTGEYVCKAGSFNKCDASRDRNVEKLADGYYYHCDAPNSNWEGYGWITEDHTRACDDLMQVTAAKACDDSTLKVCNVTVQNYDSVVVDGVTHYCVIT